ncbi:MAG TPA: ABC transporter permease [Gemmatimonadaceae bacterium]|nr:ABC transporter permease [Gemmatimonadaceae bacterium]
MLLENTWRDTRHTLRGLRATPGFTMTVLGTLALGIGANATMFSLVDRLLFRPPPLLESPDLVHRVHLYRTDRGVESTCCGGHYARFTDLDTMTRSFDVVAGVSARNMAVGTGESVREMRIGAVSADFFELFDAPPLLGRYFTPDEDRPPAGTPVVVVSHAFWQTQLGERRDVLGSTLQIGSAVYTVIGVATPGFVGLWPDQPPAAFIPITSYAGNDPASRGRPRAWWQTYRWGWMQPIVRHKPGVSVQQANADLTSVFARSYEQQRAEDPSVPPASEARPRAIVGPILVDRGPTASSTGKVAAWLGGVSIIVLLVACTNVVNLLLARALRRRREIALRLALGVSRWRLASQLLIETLVLAVAGGALGVLLARWSASVLGVALLGQRAPSQLVDPRTLVFATGVSVGVGVLAGLAPILQVRHVDLTADLRTGARAGYRRSGGGYALLVLQSALTVVLLVGAGLFVRSLRNVNAIRLGYDVDPVLVVSLNMRGVELDSAATVALRARLLEEAKTIPGVEYASLQAAIPFWSTWSAGLHVDGVDSLARFGSFDLNAVSPDYFATMGTRILRGRGITDADMRDAPPVVVVSESMARALWPGRDPVGACIKVNTRGGGRDAFDPGPLPCTTVVGIAEDIRAQTLVGNASLYYYLPSAQFNPRCCGLFVRTRGDARASLETVRRSLQRAMPGASYVVVTPFADIVGAQRRSWRLGATMFAVFGGLALALGVVGLYGVLAYSVTQRTHEMGVRSALGARGRDIVRLIVRDGLGVTLAGIALGVVVTLWSGRFVAPLLFDVSPSDPAVFVGVALALVVAALAASLVPALRAARVDPNIALRSE